jgi:hypothetical protein
MTKPCWRNAGRASCAFAARWGARFAKIALREIAAKVDRMLAIA